MKALVICRDIHVDDVAILQRPLIRNAVADHLHNRFCQAHSTERCAPLSDYKIVVPFIQRSGMQESCYNVAEPSLTSLTEVQTDLGKLP